MFIERIALIGLLVAITVLPLIYDRAARDPFTTPKRALFSVALTALAALLCIGRASRETRHSRAFLFLAGLLAAGLVSAVHAASASQAVDSLGELLFLAIPSAIVGAALLSNPRRVLLCANALGIAAFVISVVGILQHQRLDFWGYRESVELARGDGPLPVPDLLGVPGVGALLRGLYSVLDTLARPDADLAWAGPAKDFVRDLFLARPFARLPTQDGPASVYGHPNVASEVVAAGLVALAVSARAGWGSARDRGRRGIGILGLVTKLGAVATMAFYLLVTGTRGAWVGLAAAGVLLGCAFVLQAPRGRRLARCAVLVALIATGLGAAWAAGSRISVAGRGSGAAETPIERIKALFEARDPARDTILERRILWANTHTMLAPGKNEAVWPAVFGVGPGNWQVAYPLHHRRAMEHPVGTYTLRRYPDHPHQDALELLAEYGLAGVVCVVLLLGVAAARLFRRTRPGAGDGRYAALALLAMLATLLAISLFSFPLHMPVPVVLVFLAIGSALAAGDAGNGAPAGARWTSLPATQAAQVAAAGLLLAGVAALGGSRGGAAIAAALALGGALLCRLVSRPGAVIGTGGAVLFAAGLLAFPWMRSAIGTFEAAVVLASLATTALASLRLDATVVAGPPASRAMAALATLVFVIASLGARSRVQASEAFQAGIDFAWGARFIPGEREAAELRARDGYDRATALNPADFIAETARSGFLDHAGFHDDAEASARRALKLHPWLINARVELAGLFLRAGRDDASMREARVARGLNPDAVEPHLVLGDLFLRQGRRELATMEYERAIELSPGRVQPVAKIRAAQAYLTEGRELARALRHLEEAQIEGSSDPRILALVASLYSAPGAPPEFQARAHSIWKKVAAMNPLDTEARLRIAVSPLLAGEPSRAELEGILETLDQLIRSNPEFDPANVRYFRALTLWRLGRQEEALRGYREVTLLTGVAPFRKRTDDEALDAAIDALRTLQAESRPDPAAGRGPDSSPTRPGGR